MSAENREKVKAFLAEEGMKLVSYGVTGASDEKGWRQLFDFAKDMGIEIIQIESGNNTKTLDLVNKLAKEYGIKVAMHNHTQPGGFPDAVATAVERPSVYRLRRRYWALGGGRGCSAGWCEEACGPFLHDAYGGYEQDRRRRGDRSVRPGRKPTGESSRRTQTPGFRRYDHLRIRALDRRRWKRKLASASSGITPISASDADDRDGMAAATAKRRAAKAKLVAFGTAGAPHFAADRLCPYQKSL